MTTLIQSGFLQSLSHSIIASIWQMALVWLAAITVLRLFNLSSAQKFNIAFIAQLTGFVLFIITLFYSINNPGQYFFNTNNSSGITPSFNTVVEKCMPYLALIYVGILIFKFIRFTFSFRATKSLRNVGHDKMTAAYRIFTEQTSQLFSIKKKVTIFLSDKIICPLTTGFFKPIILIPAAAINHLTTQQMEAVILHELAHIKRADYLLYLIQSFIDKIFFFNIFSILLSNIIERERENACDDWVLQFRYNSMHYAEALFKLGRLKAMPLLAMPLTGKKESLLLQRIKRLLHNTHQNSIPDIRSIMLGVVSISVMMVFIFSTGLQVATTKPVKQLERIPATNTVATTTTPQKKTSATKSKEEQTKKYKTKTPTIARTNHNPEEKNITDEKIESKIAAAKDALAARQNYMVLVQQKIDSLQSAVSQYNDAVNSQIVVTPEVLNKAISYQNFKQIENMLAAAGNSVKVTESPETKDSYQKLITIEATDKNGDIHIYNVVVELYQ